MPDARVIIIVKISLDPQHHARSHGFWVGRAAQHGASKIPARFIHSDAMQGPDGLYGVLYSVVQYVLYKLCGSLVPSAATTVSRVHRSLLRPDGIRPTRLYRALYSTFVQHIQLAQL